MDYHWGCVKQSGREDEMGRGWGGGEGGREGEERVKTDQRWKGNCEMRLDSFLHSFI